MASFKSENRPTEDALRRSEARFAGILAIAADAIISIDDAQRINLFNEGAERTFGWSRDEVLGQPLSVLLPERYRAAHAGLIDAFAAAPQQARRMGERREIYGLRKDGTEFPAEASISKLDVDGERTFTVVLRDITERKESEAALRESERRLWAFLDNSSVVGWMKDDEGRYVFVSGSFNRRFGERFDHCFGKNDFDLWPREIAETAVAGDRRVLSEELETETIERMPNRDGSLSYWLVHKFPFRNAQNRLFVGGLGIDVSERVEAERALANSNAVLETRLAEHVKELRAEMQRHQESQAALDRLRRMEALGQLTGGVAHDFNNLLTVISGNLQLIALDLSEPRLLKYLEEAERAAEMGARLNHRLMTFARQRRLAPVTVNLNDEVIGVRELLRRSIGENILLSTELAEDLWPVKADPSEIENALVNLAINARDAMPDGGTVTVATRNSIVTGDGPRAGTVPPGSYVELAVSDTGAGMAADVKAHAFEPFFTTKGPGRGTGLGLATIYGFVTQSGGYVTLDSEVGHGTTVTIYMPRLESQDGGAGTVDSRAARRPAQGERILVVEDNLSVRRVTVERLRSLGYATVEAGSGQEALEVLERGTPVDLVFTDVVMPGNISGFDLARMVAIKWPSLKVVLTSGYAPDEASGTDAYAARADILAKPYSNEALAVAVSTALAAGT